MAGMNVLQQKPMKVNGNGSQLAANPVVTPQINMPGSATGPAQLAARNAALTKEQNLANIQSRVPKTVSATPPSKNRALGRTGMTPNMPSGRPYPQLPMFEPKPLRGR